MQVVSARRAVALGDVKTHRKEAKALRDYNPRAGGMVDMHSDMKAILDKATPDLHGKTRKREIACRGRKAAASASMTVCNARFERLRALKSQFDSPYEALLQPFMHRNAPPTAVAAAAIAAQLRTVLPLLLLLPVLLQLINAVLPRLLYEPERVARWVHRFAQQHRRHCKHPLLPCRLWT